MLFTRFKPPITKAEAYPMWHYYTNSFFNFKYHCRLEKKNFGKLQKNKNSQLHYQIGFLLVKKKQKEKNIFTYKLQKDHNFPNQCPAN